MTPSRPAHLGLRLRLGPCPTSIPAPCRIDLRKIQARLTEPGQDNWIHDYTHYSISSHRAKLSTQLAHVHGSPRPINCTVPLNRCPIILVLEPRNLHGRSSILAYICIDDRWNPLDRDVYLLVGSVACFLFMLTV